MSPGAYTPTKKKEKGGVASSPTHIMEVMEQELLKKAKADDFTVIELLGVGKHGLVVKAKFKSKSDVEKVYAVKLLFNFTHEYSSVISNKFENEWLVLSRLLPHPNIIRYWSQFISPISHSFLPHIPDDIRPFVIRKKTNTGENTYRNGQFLVFDCHPTTLSQWLANNRTCTTVCTPVLLMKFSYELLKSINYLQGHNVCHLDLKLDNVLVSVEMNLVLCDFGCAIQFEDSKFELQWMHGLSVGGNRAHLSPEVLTGYHRCRTTPGPQKKISYKKQAAFAAGVLIHEIITGEHPLEDYPLSQMLDGKVSYSTSAMCLKIPPTYPSQFQQTVKGLILSNESERMDVSVALSNVEKVLLAETNHSLSLGNQSNLEEELKSLRNEKEFAEVN